ncbi:MAG: hypothetical protein AAF957_06300 [Planctomycetota bacterium]
MAASERLRPVDLIAPLGAGLLVRALVVWSFIGFAGTGDERTYLGLGRDWHDFGAYGGMWAPLFPGLLGLLHGWFGDAAGDALRVLHLGLAAWIGATVAQIAALFGGRRAGVAAAWIHALYLPLAGFSGLLFSEVVFLALFTPALLQLLLLAKKGQGSAPWWRAPLAGALVGLATLTRESTLLLVPLLTLWVAWSVRAAGARAIALAGVFALATTLVLSPWTARNLHAYGHLVPVATSTGGSTFVGINAYDVNFDLAGLGASAVDAPGALRARLRGPRPEPWTSDASPNFAERAQINVRQALGYAREHPTFYARSRVVEFVDLVSPVSFIVRSLRIGPVSPPLAATPVRQGFAVAAVLAVPLLMLLALRGWARARSAPVLCSLALTVVFGTCAFALVNGMSRYRVTALPVLIALAAMAYATTATPPSRVRRLIATAGAVLLVLAWIPSLEPTRLALAGLW